MCLYRITRQRDKNHGNGSRSKLAVSSPARSRKATYQLAPSRALLAEDEDLRESVVDVSERINLQSYDNEAEGRGRINNTQETSYILDERPPVEGRDSLSKDKVDSEINPKPQNINDDLYSASYVPPSRSNIATVRELRTARPKVEPLPLLENGDRADLSSPGSQDGSPFTKTQLFADEKIESPLSDVVADDTNVDFEYDDYMPQLPGSYFTMDPHAYTLTWSRQPSWAHQCVISRTGSDASVDRSMTSAEQF